MMKINKLLNIKGLINIIFHFIMHALYKQFFHLER